MEEEKQVTFKEQLIKLIDVKTIVTFIFVSVYNYLTVVGVVEPSGFETLVVMIVSFYFGTQVGKKINTK